MKILIDNGHGKNTSGKRSPDQTLMEWSWNREVAIMLYNTLKSHGYDCEMLVTEDIDISLGERCRRANAWCNKLGASNVILISIHGNAEGMGDRWGSGNGWEVWTSKGKTNADALAECIFNAAKTSFPGRKLRSDRTDGDSDKESDFYILKHTACPAVLTENFFYTNLSDWSFMMSEKGKQAIVDCHFNGIINYLQSIKSKHYER